MAGLAGGRESRRDVIWICCGGENRFVARVAIGGGSRIASADMAVATGNAGVCAGQRERGVVVIER